MKIAYFDCFAGISGDMTLGALVDLGVDPKAIEDAVRGLGVEGFAIDVRHEERCQIGGTRVRVKVTGDAGHDAQDHPHAPHGHHERHDHPREPHEQGHPHDQGHHHEHHGHHHEHHELEKQRAHPHRHLGDIEAILDRGSLDPAVRERARAAFRLLAEAESRVHRVPVEEVHLHEVGAVDAIVDIVGAAVGLHALGIERVFASPVVVGRGFASGEHGPIPIPGPATLEILSAVPIRQGPVEAEMTTPTGAAILRTIAHGFGPMPDLRVERVGYGCGERSFDELPNLLRVVVGETTGEGGGEGRMESAVLLSANLDDLSPQTVAYAVERLLSAGALDAWLVPAVMKKGRAGVVLQALATPERADALAGVILAETSTLGVRRETVSRQVLDRRWDEVETAYGRIRIKVGTTGAGEAVNALPEHDDCARAAAAKGVPLKEVQAAAIEAWRRRRSTG